jgi:C4-dicarboxylate-specific signal transduction histidine kinase
VNYSGIDKPLQFTSSFRYDAWRGQIMTIKNTIDGTPEKHIFRGMIADYDLQTGLCELLDNALDFWVANKRRSKLKVEVGLDVSRQIITVRDNAGGVKENDLRLLIAPGASRETSTENLIGIFGVGGK